MPESFLARTTGELIREVSEGKYSGQENRRGMKQRGATNLWTLSYLSLQPPPQRLGEARSKGSVSKTLLSSLLQKVPFSRWPVLEGHRMHMPLS